MTSRKSGLRPSVHETRPVSRKHGRQAMSVNHQTIPHQAISTRTEIKLPQQGQVGWKVSPRSDRSKSGGSALKRHGKWEPCTATSNLKNGKKRERKTRALGSPRLGNAAAKSGLALASGGRDETNHKRAGLSSECTKDTGTTTEKERRLARLASGLDGLTDTPHSVARILGLGLMTSSIAQRPRDGAQTALGPGNCEHFSDMAIHGGVLVDTRDA